MTTSSSDRVEWALKEISTPGSESVRAAISILVAADADAVEPPLLALVLRTEESLEVGSTASRILIERDPDRDPAFLVDKFSLTESEKAGRPGRIYGKFEHFMIGDHPFAAMCYQFGFPRLRRANPIEHYSDMLSHRFSHTRGFAAIGLGDTADLTALTPLARALSDRNPAVRKHAADAVRRLRHAGAAQQMPEHPVHQKLLACLDDTKRDVRVAAARALGSLGETGTLTRHRARRPAVSWRRRRDIEQVLRGHIPPLVQLWPGDETV